MSYESVVEKEFPVSFYGREIEFWTIAKATHWPVIIHCSLPVMWYDRSETTPP